MSKPITITIPDSLHARLKKYKEKLNVSQVCQKALDEKIRDWERKTEAIQGDPEMGEIIARLRKQKQELENEWRNKGLKAGLHIAKFESYEYLKFLATKLKTTNEQKEGEKFDFESLSPREREIYNDSWEEYLDEPAHFDNDRDEDLYPPDNYGSADFLAWEEGCIESIRRFWEEVKDKI